MRRHLNIVIRKAATFPQIRSPRTVDELGSPVASQDLRKGLMGDSERKSEGSCKVTLERQREREGERGREGERQGWEGR